jgi:hypothetical protein
MADEETIWPPDCCHQLHDLYCMPNWSVAIAVSHLSCDWSNRNERAAPRYATRYLPRVLLTRALTRYCESNADPPNMQHFLGPIFTEGLLTSGIMAIGRCLTEPEVNPLDAQGLTITNFS